MGQAATQPSTNWHLKENARDHHTSKFSSKELIVRRGQAFIVTFNGTEQPEQNLTFIAETGPKPSKLAKTQATFGISSTVSKESWSAVLQSTSSNSVSISISSPPNAVIGRYKLSVRSTSSDSSSPASLGTFVLLFNPWSSGDDVFMPNKAECDEYVLEEFGIIFAGNKNHINSFGWNFGQFQEDILNICLSMLDRSLNYRQDPATDVSHRNDPKYLGRVLSAMVNANDDQGVLLGNWSGNYDGGKSPSSWTGSGEILQNWKKSGFKPVRYGQCWVFAAVLTTVLRCLGIPTRTITNFSSAHDADGNLRVDEFYDASGNHLDRAADSIWNFHVWNESWFSRSDLGPSYSGWQVLDATPQEESGGIYQCGPASRNAIKEGDVDLDYDCPFVFAEVNADCMYWNYDPATGKKTLMFSKSTVIGQFISTKAVGRDDRVDVTNDYKYEEGSKKERDIFKKARKKLGLEDKFDPTAPTPQEIDQKPDIAGKFKVAGPLEVGKDLNLILVLANLQSDAKTVHVNMTAWSTVYTRRPVHEIWKDSIPVTLSPKEEKQFPIKISYTEYQQQLTTDNTIQVTALCHVEGGIQVLVQRDITLDNPAIDIQVLGEAKVNKEVDVEVIFTNPIDMEVTDCVLQVEGNDLLRGVLEIAIPPLKASEKSSTKFKLIPFETGPKHLLVNFSCDKFADIKNFKMVNVID
ncbi:protein-glutamine gamma-glutamyltransferase E isoform X1 [Haliaeetus albicilla]|uniref:protein-glutamine gamma-glutamyltransferase E-like n=1 Tax=Haliaeetus leucocephalus TaxID=52644 RepID=UPI000522672F|nr:PREDICTED: protein-glutamine gamma-glutamyltransferase E [Haliaeetus albicilla]XP_010567637.1 PREDICTED: protein-glutamine gamma-glutamyltransferase E-like [Haliaeetus leucocephalus]